MSKILTIPPTPGVITSRELLALQPGARIVDDEGRDYCVVGIPKCVPEGKPGRGRVRLEVLQLDGLDGQVREWVEARGWYKSLFYFHTRTVRGDHVTSLEHGRYKR